MELAGHECVGHVEIDKYANKSYEAMHNPKEGEFFATDIRDVRPDDLPDDISNTLTSVQKDNLLLQQDRIRRLTPKECFRLQGFPDKYFERAAAVNSDSQLYKQAGNSVTVNVIHVIAERLAEIERYNKCLITK